MTIDSPSPPIGRVRVPLACIVIGLMFSTAGCDQSEQPRRDDEAVPAAAPAAQRAAALQAKADSPTSSQHDHSTQALPGTVATAQGPVAPQEDVPEVCLAMCEHTAILHCGPKDTCLSRCTLMLADDLCQAEMQAFLTCAVARPSSDWECSPDQVAALKDGVCTAQQEGFVVCAEAAIGAQIAR